MSEQEVIGIVVLGGRACNYTCRNSQIPSGGPVLQLWAAMGTLSGGLVAYFFTREQVQRQESQTRMFEAAYRASEKKSVEAGKQLWEVAAKVKPENESPETQQAIEKLLSVAGDLFSPQVPVGTTETPKPLIHPSPSTHCLWCRDLANRKGPNLLVILCPRGNTRE
jgi:hypothetical protein